MATNSSRVVRRDTAKGGTATSAVFAQRGGMPLFAAAVNAAHGGITTRLFHFINSLFKIVLFLKLINHFILFQPM